MALNDLDHSWKRTGDAGLAAAATTLMQLCIDARYFVTPDGRISLEVASKLLGISHGHLRNLVSQGTGPVVYRLGGRGHRLTVSLVDLAAWRESRRV